MNEKLLENLKEDLQNTYLSLITIASEDNGNYITNIFVKLHSGKKICIINCDPEHYNIDIVQENVYHVCTDNLNLLWIRRIMRETKRYDNTKAIIIAGLEKTTLGEHILSLDVKVHCVYQISREIGIPVCIIMKEEEFNPLKTKIEEHLSMSISYNNTANVLCINKNTPGAIGIINLK